MTVQRRRDNASSDDSILSNAPSTNNGMREPLDQRSGGRRHSRRRLFGGLVAYHLLLACWTRTFFQPDEYWQSLEVAHRIAVGYGYLTWEWTAHTRDKKGALPIEAWSHLLRSGQDWVTVFDALARGPVRGPLYALFFVPIYKLLGYFDPVVVPFEVLSVAPRLLQAFASSVTAYMTFKVAEIFSERTAWATLLSMLTSPFYMYTACRTLSNNLETTLTISAMYQCLAAQRDFRGRRARVVLSLLLAALACLVRPTSGLVWPPFYLYFLHNLLMSHRRIDAAFLAAGAVVVGTASICLAAAIDTMFYGRPTLTMLSFFIQNVANSISNFYGAQPWHWYLSQGLPVLGMTALPFMLMGARILWTETQINRYTGRWLVFTVTWTLATYSFALAHKEWRFLLPMVPLLHVFSGRSLGERYGVEAGIGKSMWSRIWQATSTVRKSILLCTLPFSIYLIGFHGVAQTTHLPRYLRQRENIGEVRSIGFLMPCHSTPWQSHWHMPSLELTHSARPNGSGDWGKLWFLTCEPPEASEMLQSHKDQSDYFYQDPPQYLESYFPSDVQCNFPPAPGWNQSRDPMRFGKHCGPSAEGCPHSWPSHFVVFEALLKDSAHGKSTAQFLLSKGYRETKRLWNSLGHDDSRRRGPLVVFSLALSSCPLQ